MPWVLGLVWNSWLSARRTEDREFASFGLVTVQGGYHMDKPLVNWGSPASGRIGSDAQYLVIYT
jgi:hypothetical protein